MSTVTNGATWPTFGLAAGAPAWSAPDNISAVLENRLRHLIARVEASEVYRAMTALDATPAMITATLGQIFLSMAHSQPRVARATLGTVGRLPGPVAEPVWAVIFQQLAGAGHAGQALNVYERLGGDPAKVNAPMTPASRALVSACHGLCVHMHAACCLGYMYLFEALTPEMAARAQRLLERTSCKAQFRAPVDLRAGEDLCHTDMIITAIEELVAMESSAAGHVLQGFDCVARVYPVPVWNEALARARRELGEHAA